MYIDCCSIYIYIDFRLKDSAPIVWILTVEVSIVTPLLNLKDCTPIVWSLTVEVSIFT